MRAPWGKQEDTPSPPFFLINYAKKKNKSHMLLQSIAHQALPILFLTQNLPWNNTSFCTDSYSLLLIITLSIRDFFVLFFLNYDFSPLHLDPDTQLHSPRDQLLCDPMSYFKSKQSSGRSGCCSGTRKVRDKSGMRCENTAGPDLFIFAIMSWPTYGDSVGLF